MRKPEGRTSSHQSPLPTRTTVGVSLAGFLVEIDCVAVLPSGADNP
jgi:enamine deaminase RidA (YjgF/YER057c/UK114 family)